jgi:transposase
LWEQGVSPRQIAVALDRSVRTIYRCVATARDQGAQELAARWPSGAPPKLSDQQRDELIGRLLQGAQAHGFETDLWTGPRIQRLIREQFGVEYHVKYIPTFLKTLGFSAQKPECLARERNEAEIAHWLACDWPRVKKKRVGAGR